MAYIPYWEQLATDHHDPWQVVSRQEFTPCYCLMIKVASVVLCCVGCLCVTAFDVIACKNSMNNNFHDFPGIFNELFN